MDFEHTQKKEIKAGFQHANFFVYAEFFTEEHAHWSEKIKRVKCTKKLNSMRLFYLQKANRLKVKKSVCWKLIFSIFKFIHWSPLHITINFLFIYSFIFYFILTER